MSQLEAFRKDVEEFLKLGVVSPTQLGKEALGDPSFVPDLRSGRRPLLSTVDKVLAFIQRKTPAAGSTTEKSKREVAPSRQGQAA